MGMVNMGTYKSQRPGLSDVLEYAAMVEDGIMLTKKGLMAAFYYRGVDIESSTDNERNSIAARTNHALARLGSGFITHHDAVRIPAGAYPAPAENHFPDPVSRLIDNERRAQFQHEGAHYESLYVLTVTYIPSAEETSRFRDLLLTGGEDQRKKTGLDKALAFFKDSLDQLEQMLAASVRISRMRGVEYQTEDGNTHINDQLLEYVNYCVCGVAHPINLPPVPMYVDQLISQDFIGGMEPQVGDQHIAVVAIDGFPENSYQGILAVLDQLPITYRWSTRFIYMDPHESEKRLKAFRRKWQQKVRPFFDQVTKNPNSQPDGDAVEMVNDANNALAEASSQLVAYGYYTSVVVLMDESRETVNETAKDVRDVIRRLGFGARIETINAVEAWLGSLPGHFMQNVRRPHMHSLNLADLLPLTSVWAGHERAPCPFYDPDSPPLMYAATSGATPFRFNLHSGDLGHTLIFGPTGAGKSTLLALIAAQFRRYPGATITAFDKGRSMMPLTLACQGYHHDFNGEFGNPPRLCPLNDLDSDGDQAWAQGWIESLVKLQGVAVTPDMRNHINHALTTIRETAQKGEGRSLTDFQTTVQSKEVKEALVPYVLGGPVGHLLDAEENNIEGEAVFEVFEIEELMEMGETHLIPVLLYLFRRFEKSLKGQPALLILDEAWIMLGHPVFKAKIREWLKVLRRANCAVVLATQSLSDATRSGIIDVLQESCPTKIYLPNVEAFNRGNGDTPGPRDIYESMGLNEQQIRIIKDATPKREYYFTSTDGRRLIDLNLGPATLAFIGVSGKNDLKAISDMSKSDPEDWPWQWLQQRGVSYEKYVY